MMMMMIRQLVLILIIITIVSSYNHHIIRSNIITSSSLLSPASISLRLSSSSSTTTTADNNIPINCKPVTKRNDNIIEKGALLLISLALALISPQRNKALKLIGYKYDNFVKVSKTLLIERDTSKISKRIVSLLVSLIPLQVRQFFRENYSKDPRLLCEQSSQWMSFGFLQWLVGKTERTTVDIEINGTKEAWLSGVKLTECRYLIESGCKATCLYLCKGPTQTFFNEELGVPMHMKPNFQDCSCEMIFGRAPPLKENDENYGTPCYLSCSIANPNPTNNNSNNDDSDINKLLVQDIKDIKKPRNRRCS